MKRVNAITKGKASFITDLVDRKAKRIMRAVEQAIDCAADKDDSFRSRAEEIPSDFPQEQMTLELSSAASMHILMPLETQRSGRRMSSVSRI